MPLSSLKSCGSPLAPRDWASGNGVIPLSPHPRVEAPRLVAIVGPTATGKSQLALDLAKAFHPFYQQCRVVSQDPGDLPVTMARLKLVDAVRIVFARCLSLMGMAAPERM